MKEIVAVIDPNPAVRAIAEAALQPLGMAVEALAEEADLPLRLKRLRPFIIFISSDWLKDDVLELCRTLKDAPEMKESVFVLLAPSGGRESLLPNAREAGIREILYKPFKSHQMRELAQRLHAEREIKDLESTAEQLPVELNYEQFAVVSKDALLQATITRLLENRGLSVYRFDSLADYTKQNTHQGCLIFHNTPDETKHLDILARDCKLLILNEQKGKSPDKITKQHDTASLERPLDLSSLDQAMSALFPAYESSSPPGRRLSLKELSVFAAMAGACLYESLLSSQAFKRQHWQEAFKEASEKALNKCLELAANLED